MSNESNPDGKVPPDEPVNDAHILHDGLDEKGHHVHRAVTTLDEVKEEHIYVIYMNPYWQMTLEVDLVGDQAVFESDGKLPPVLHLICPKCARNGHPDNALSITHASIGGTKTFEIEDLDPKDYGVVTDEKGAPLMGSDGEPAIVKRRLTIKEPFKCEYCSARFKITDNQMRDA
jgi:hypothetical protein